jgi:hypothetical protein
MAIQRQPHSHYQKLTTHATEKLFVDEMSVDEMTVNEMTYLQIRMKMH